MARTKQSVRAEGGKVPRKSIVSLKTFNQKSKSTRLTSKASKKRSHTAKSTGKRSSIAGTKRTVRHRPGTVALREIKKYQRTTELLCRRLPFARLVRHIMSKLIDFEAAESVDLVLGRRKNPEGKTEFRVAQQTQPERFSRVAITALQEATEAWIIKMLEAAHLTALHAKRVTVMNKDVDLIGRLFRHEFGHRRSVIDGYRYERKSRPMALAARK